MLAPVDRDLLDELREEWRWAVPDEYTPYGMTLIGDWLFLGPSGAVHLLETIEAAFTQIAGSLDELERAAESPEARDMFLEALALAVLRGEQLPRNHCVGFCVPPILGAETDVSNLEIVPVRRYQLWTARIHKAIADAPTGCRITGVDVDDRGFVSVRWC
jgi:hypothetical protein